MAKSEPKNQHFVPQSYLAAFVDPNTPLDKKPYVWVFSRNGKKKYPNSPDTIFKVKHLYTLKIKGQKDYSIENTLGEIEGQYATIFREKIKNRLPLNDFEHVMLCVFVSTMLFRTISQKVYHCTVKFTLANSRSRSIGVFPSIPSPRCFFWKL